MISPQRRKLLEGLQQKISVTFLNDALLSQALTHSSYAHEVQGESKVRPSDNERLEFMGDAVLKVIISEYLYNKYPQYAEGDLTKIRATVVSDATLSAVAENQLELGTYLALGRNEKASGGAHRPSNLANALEALIASIYLDQGIGKARDVVVALLAPEVERVSQKGFIVDYKSALQELAQKNKWGLPLYKVAKETGPKHKKVFWVEVRVHGRKMGRGQGFNKKSAEQSAAAMALKLLKREKPQRGLGAAQTPGPAGSAPAHGHGHTPSPSSRPSLPSSSRPGFGSSGTTRISTSGTPAPTRPASTPTRPAPGPGPSKKPREKGFRAIRNFLSSTRRRIRSTEPPAS